MASRSVLVVLALLVTPVVALVPSADACSAVGAVPCGRIYPQILMKIPDQQPVYDVAQGVPLALEAELTFRFDMANEGYTVPSPNDPIVVRFEFPRKPAWAEIAVEPESITIPVHDLTRVQADPTAATPQAHYVYTTRIGITATVVGQPVLRDGYDYAKLLVFAKSTESGLYQAGYGIKEIRIAPEGALHESDLAGTRDTFVASPLPALALETVTASFGEVTATLTPPAQAKFWEPAAFGVQVQPAFRGKMVVALHDERGGLVAHTPPLDAASGAAALNATLVRPGLHTATVTLLPEGADVPPVTIPLHFQAGDLAAEGWEFPKTYALTTTEPVPLPAANREDALAQFERDVPFFAFDTAQSVMASVTLATPGLDALGRSVANLQFSIHDPDGNLLAQKSVDPTKPTDALRIGSLPSEGWFVVRLKGVGLPAGAAYTVRVEATYSQPAQQRNLADGRADATGPLLGLGGHNVTLPVAELAPWTPADVTPVLEGFGNARYALTIFDANGTLAYATGVRTGGATFSPPAPEAYRGFVYLEPTAPGTAFSPVVRAFSFGAANATTTVATTFTLEDAFASRLAEGVVAIHQVRVHDGAAGGDIVVEGGRALVGAPGEAPTEATSLPLDKPVVLVYVLSDATAAGAAASGSVRAAVEYAQPVTLVGADVLPAAGGAPEAPVPFLAAGLLLALTGFAAVALALATKR